MNPWHVSQLSGKEYNDASRYYDTFLQRYTELEALFVMRVASGNLRATRGTRVQRVLQIKLEQIGGRVASAQQAYTYSQIAIIQKGAKNFVEDIHSALLFLLYKHGFENWVGIAAELRRLKMFQFNSAAQALSVDDIERWCIYVIRCVEKEVSKFQAKRQSLEEEVETARAALTALAASDAPGAGDAEIAEARSRLELATAELAAHRIPQDSCSDLVYVAQMSETQQADLNAEWIAVLKQPPQPPEQGQGEPQHQVKMEVEADARSIVHAETPESKGEPVEGRARVLAAAAASSSAGSSVRARKPGRRALQLPERPEMTLEAAMRQIKRGAGKQEKDDGGGTPGENKEGGSEGGAAGADAGSGPSDPITKPVASRKRAPADPNKPKAQRAPKRKTDELGASSSEISLSASSAPSAH